MTPDRAAEGLDWYRALVVAGAQESAFLNQYISALAAVTAVADPDAGRARRHLRLLGP